MWTRKELKTKGLASFRANRWRCILIGLIFVLVGGGTINLYLTPSETGGSGDSEFFATAFGREIVSATENLPRPVLAAMLAVFAAVAIIGIILTITIVLPAELGANRFFVMNLNRKAEVKEIGFGFDHSYKNVVRVMFLYHVKVILWALLLIIPGAVKLYEYRMVPYLLAEHPEMDSKEIFSRSRDMMKGQKWSAFILDVSFVGWHLLGALTLGVVEILYTIPYWRMTDAALYERLMYGETDV